MLRTALQPRWLALLAVVLVLCATFGWLGSWQLGVARDRGHDTTLREQASRPPAPLGQVLQPQQGFPVSADGRSVVAHGTYDPARQVLVGERLQHGHPGWWVVGALRAESGAWLPVVRGWVAAPDDARALARHAPSGAVEVDGVLLPDDASPDAPAARGSTRLAALDAAELVNRWGSPIYNGFLVATAERADGAPVGAGAGQPERVPPPQPQAGGLAWRNAAYAVQWWVFAGFALVLWWKMVRQDERDERARLTGEREKVSV